MIGYVIVTLSSKYFVDTKPFVRFFSFQNESLSLFRKLKTIKPHYIIFPLTNEDLVQSKHHTIQWMLQTNQILEKIHLERLQK